MSTRTRFEEEAKGNSEMAYSSALATFMDTDMKMFHAVIKIFRTFYILWLHSIYFSVMIHFFLPSCPCNNLHVYMLVWIKSFHCN